MIGYTIHNIYVYRLCAAYMTTWLRNNVNAPYIYICTYVFNVNINMQSFRKIILDLKQMPKYATFFSTGKNSKFVTY